MLRCLQDLQEGPRGDDGDAGVFAQGKEVGVAGHNVVRVALRRTGQDHVSAGSAGVGGAKAVEPPTLPRLSDPVRDAAGPDGHADEEVRVQDGPDHRRARAARTASALVASSTFAGTFRPFAWTRPTFLKRPPRSCRYCS